MVCDRRVQHPTPCMSAGVSANHRRSLPPYSCIQTKSLRYLQQSISSPSATNESPQVRCVLQRDPRQPSLLLYYEGGCGKWTGGQLCRVIGVLVKVSLCVAKRARAMFPSVQAAIDEFDALDIMQPWQARSQPAPGAARAAAGATGEPGTSACRGRGPRAIEV